MSGGVSDKTKRTIAAIADTFNPSLDPSGTDNPHFFRNSAIAQGVAGRIEKHIESICASEQDKVIRFLARLDSPFFGLKLRRGGYSFSNAPLARRVSIVRRILESDDSFAKWTLRSIQRLSLQGSYVTTGPVENHSSNAAMYEAIGYSTENQKVPRPQSLEASTIADRQISFACHYLVIGSGAAGAVMAAELAETGKSVLLVDAGRIVPGSELGLSESRAIRDLYQTFGTWANGDNEVLITTARTFGGGPVANWGTCYSPPRQVLQEWANRFGFVDVLNDDFEHSVYTVKRRLEVSTKTSIVNRQNHLLRQGIESLGLPTKLLERNASGCSGCDRCEFGCASGARRDTQQTYLMDAQRLGVYLLPKCEITKLNFKNDVAFEAEGILRDESGNPRDVRLQFRHVVVCGGAIHTPAILLRSGIRLRHLGKNLYLHPSAIVNAFFKDRVCAWDGPAQSIASDCFANLDGAGNGVLLETAPVHPGLAALYLPWNDPWHHKRLMQGIDHLAAILVLCRDSGHGELAIDSRGRPKIKYRFSPYDNSHLRSGIRLATAAMQTAGAETVYLPNWRSPGIDCLITKNLASYLAPRTLRDRDLSPEWKLFSAHQMSTCRIGASPTEAVVDHLGRVFGTKNVYVTDASVFPTAIGVNPMITVTALSHYLAQGIKAVT